MWILKRPDKKRSKAGCSADAFLMPVKASLALKQSQPYELQNTLRRLARIIKFIEKERSNVCMLDIIC